MRAMEGDQHGGSGGWLGNGEDAAQTLARDWSHNALGAIDEWRQCLRTALSICLHSSEPVAVHWGPEFITLYNDVCAELLGDAHPDSLGRPAALLYESVWTTIGPLFNRTLTEGVSTVSRNQPLPMTGL